MEIDPRELPQQPDKIPKLHQPDLAGSSEQILNTGAYKITYIKIAKNRQVIAQVPAGE